MCVKSESQLTTDPHKRKRVRNRDECVRYATLALEVVALLVPLGVCLVPPGWFSNMSEGQDAKVAPNAPHGAYFFSLSPKVTMFVFCSAMLILLLGACSATRCWMMMSPQHQEESSRALVRDATSCNVLDYFPIFVRDLASSASQCFPSLRHVELLNEETVATGVLTALASMGMAWPAGEAKPEAELEQVDSAVTDLTPHAHNVKVVEDTGHVTDATALDFFFCDPDLGEGAGERREPACPHTCSTELTTDTAEAKVNEPPVLQCGTADALLASWRAGSSAGWFRAIVAAEDVGQVEASSSTAGSLSRLASLWYGGTEQMTAASPHADTRAAADSPVEEDISQLTNAATSGRSPAMCSFFFCDPDTL